MDPVAMLFDEPTSALDPGMIIEDVNKDNFFSHPASNRARGFLARILH